MPPKHLHILGVTPGSVTGWCRLTIPRNSIFGDDGPAFLERKCGHIQGTLPDQAIALSRLARGIQSLDYLIGPAIIVEEFEIGDDEDSTEICGWEDLYQIRIGAMLRLLKQQNLLGDATINFRPFGVAQDIEDKQLRRHGLLYKQEYINDAARLALASLRLARNDYDYARQLWPYESGVWNMEWE